MQMTADLTNGYTTFGKCNQSDFSGLLTAPNHSFLEYPVIIALRVPDFLTVLCHSNRQHSDKSAGL